MILFLGLATIMILEYPCFLVMLTQIMGPIKFLLIAYFTYLWLPTNI